MNANDGDAYLFLSLLQAKVGTSLISRLGDLPPSAVFETPLAELARRTAMTEKAVRAFDELERGFDPEEIRDRLAGKGVEVLTPSDEAYPGRLRSIPDPPPALFVDGRLPDAPCVALVGSRKASVTGIETARDLGRALGERGVCVVSGLALGVDTAAHEGALGAGGPTAGVLGCGIDVVYPRGNMGLFGRVKENGAVVSEYSLGEAPLAWRFPARNRIIAGLCDAVVVVEAPGRSGALITARHALDAGRDVWAVPGHPSSPECRGSNGLLADGAGVLWDVAEFVDAVAAESGAPETGERGAVELPLPVGLPASEAAVLSGVETEPAGVDSVAKRSGVGTREALTALALLELKGYVRRDAGGAYARRAIR